MNKRLRELRKETKLTQRDVAKFIGVSKSTYSNYEQGIREPSYDILIQICKFYGVTLDYLIGLEY